MQRLTLMVPENLVARVDRALKREGLDVRTFTSWCDEGEGRTVVEGQAPRDVPRVIAHDGPPETRWSDDSMFGH